jgi:coproporphyrinogen III oxidase
MDIEIKKDLASNWFKLLQNAICDDISRLEKNRVKFKSTSWKRSKKKMRVVVNTELSQMEKFLKKWE